MTDHDHGPGGQRARTASQRDSESIRPRTVSVLMLLWTGSMIAWFLSALVGGLLPTPAVALAVGGLIGVVWLLGVLVLSLFLFMPRD